MAPFTTSLRETLSDFRRFRTIAPHTVP
jgi:hypothetical protein